MFQLRLAVALVCIFPVFVAQAEPARETQRVVAYVPNWIDLNLFADSIDYAKVTHLNLAFENPVNDAGDLSFQTNDAALVTKAAAHGVPVLISIGGGSASEDKTLLARYAGLLGNAKRRAGFVEKLARYVSAHDFAGVDVDLEGDSIGPDYGAFIVELSAALKGEGKLITAALPKRYNGGKVSAEALRCFDFANVMAYDATGPWNPGEPGQHSSRELAVDSAQYWLGRGLPKEKIVLGVPFYGYGFGHAFRQRDYPYREIVRKFPDAEAHDQAGDTIWYNGRPTIQAKAAYVRSEGLGGVMIWSLDEDVPGPGSLLNVIHETLNAPSIKP